MSKFKNMYKQICEDFQLDEKYALVQIKGTSEKCPLFIKNEMKRIFRSYVLSDRFLTKHLNVVVNFDENLVNVEFDNPGADIPDTITAHHVATFPAGAESREVFNDLSQRFLDWCELNDVVLEDYDKQDDPHREKFTLFMVSNSFMNAVK